MSDNDGVESELDLRSVSERADSWPPPPPSLSGNQYDHLNYSSPKNSLSRSTPKSAFSRFKSSFTKKRDSGSSHQYHQYDNNISPTPSFRNRNGASPTYSERGKPPSYGRIFKPKRLSDGSTPPLPPAPPPLPVLDDGRQDTTAQEERSMQHASVICVEPNVETLPRQEVSSFLRKEEEGNGRGRREKEGGVTIKVGGFGTNGKETVTMDRTTSSETVTMTGASGNGTNNMVKDSTWPRTPVAPARSSPVFTAAVTGSADTVTAASGGGPDDQRRRIGSAMLNLQVSRTAQDSCIVADKLWFEATRRFAFGQQSLSPGPMKIPEGVIPPSSVVFLEPKSAEILVSHVGTNEFFRANVDPTDAHCRHSTFVDVYNDTRFVSASLQILKQHPFIMEGKPSIDSLDMRERAWISVDTDIHAILSAWNGRVTPDVYYYTADHKSPTQAYGTLSNTSGRATGGQSIFQLERVEKGTTLLQLLTARTGVKGKPTKDFSEFVHHICAFYASTDDFVSDENGTHIFIE